jgi:hypothetical protein
MHNLNLFSNDNVPKDREEGKDRWEGRGTVDNKEWDVVDLDSIREVSHSSSSFICVRDNYDFVAPVDELRRELIDVAFDSSRLGKEPVAHHRNIVGHGGVSRCSTRQRISSEEQGYWEEVIVVVKSHRVVSIKEVCRALQLEDALKFSRG